MNDYVSIFKAMADETRLRILNLLLTAEKKICVCEMVDALQLPQYRISKHLTILKNVRLVQVTREGTWVYYGLNREDPSLLKDLFGLLKDDLNDDYSEDVHNLQLRLSLREKGKCMVGFNAPEQWQALLRKTG